MNRDKQIEEMAIVLTDGGCKSCDGCSYNDRFNCLPIYSAELLYNAGYRKASDVAREIFEEIDRMIYKVLNDRHYIMGDMCWEVAELKKKYTESEDTE